MRRPLLRRSSRSGCRLRRRSGWLRGPQLRDSSRKRVVDAIQCAAIDPQIEIAVNSAVWRQVLRDRAPLTARRENMHEAIHHLAHIRRALASAVVRGGYKQNPYPEGERVRQRRLGQYRFPIRRRAYASRSDVP